MDLVVQVIYLGGLELIELDPKPPDKALQIEGAAAFKEVFGEGKLFKVGPKDLNGL